MTSNSSQYHGVCCTYSHVHEHEDTDHGRQDTTAAHAYCNTCVERNRFIITIFEKEWDNMYSTCTVSVCAYVYVWVRVLKPLKSNKNQKSSQLSPELGPISNFIEGPALTGVFFFAAVGADFCPMLEGFERELMLFGLLAVEEFEGDLS